jgi:2-amino-4-hydroxy-6-hydroxymethyldihydropteridine diphosphokinase
MRVLKKPSSALQKATNINQRRARFILMTTAYIAAGSNLGNRIETFQKAANLLAQEVELKRQAPVYETDPVGGPAQGKYLNTVWEIETSLSAKGLLQTLLSIEKKLGRERGIKNAPRTIDLDLLFYGTETLQEENLEVPHPRLQDRLFVLQPLLDLAPGFKHPVNGKTIRQLWKEASASQPALIAL